MWYFHWTVTHRTKPGENELPSLAISIRICIFGCYSHVGSVWVSKGKRIKVNLRNSRDRLITSTCTSGNSTKAIPPLKMDQRVTLAAGFYLLRTQDGTIIQSIIDLRTYYVRIQFTSEKSWSAHNKWRYNSTTASWRLQSLDFTTRSPARKCLKTGQMRSGGH